MDIFNNSGSVADRPKMRISSAFNATAKISEISGEVNRAPSLFDSFNPPGIQASASADTPLNAFKPPVSEAKPKGEVSPHLPADNGLERLKTPVSETEKIPLTVPDLPADTPAGANRADVAPSVPAGAETDAKEQGNDTPVMLTLTPNANAETSETPRKRSAKETGFVSKTRKAKSKDSAPDSQDSVGSEAIYSEQKIVLDNSDEPPLDELAGDIETPFIYLNKEYYEYFRREGMQRKKIEGPLSKKHVSQIIDTEYRKDAKDRRRFDDFVTSLHGIKHQPIHGPNVGRFLEEKKDTGHINIYLNSYSPLAYPFAPYAVPNLPTNTERLLKHVFGVQYEKILDYITLCLKEPTRKLPAIVLLSKARGTGKSTFSDFMRAMFSPNALAITGDYLSGKFNEQISTKAIITYEEGKITSQTVNKIKNYITEDKTMFEEKGEKAKNRPFFGKIIITSNDIYNCLAIDPEELDRFWVVDVPPIERVDADLSFKIKEEIPEVLRFFWERLTPERKGKERLFFDKGELETDALHRLIKHNSTGRLSRQIVNAISEVWARAFELEGKPLKTLDIAPNALFKKVQKEDGTLNDFPLFARKIEEITGVKPKLHRTYYKLYSKEYDKPRYLKANGVFTIHKAKFDDLLSQFGIGSVADLETIPELDAESEK